MVATQSTYTNGQHRAVDQLLARLEEPRTAEALNLLLDHAELLACSAVALDGFLRRGDVIAGNMASSIADIRHAASTNGTLDGAALEQLVERLPRLAGVALQASELVDNPEFQRTVTILNRPETLYALNRLLGLLTESPAATRSNTPMPGETNGITARDNADALAQLMVYLPRLVTIAPKLIEIVERLQPFIASREFDAVLESGVFHRETVSLVGRAGDAFVESYDSTRRTNRRFGPIRMVRAFFDPDVQRTITLGLTFFKRFGQSLHR